MSTVPDPAGSTAPPPPAPTPDTRKRPLPARLLAAGTRVFILLLALWALTVAAIHLYGRRDEAQRVDAIVVLGAAQYDGRPSPVLRARLDHAVSLYRRGLAPVVIMTGGVGPGDTVSEAVASQRYAVKRGIPRDAILTERTGLTTLESMNGVAELMRARGLNRALLVSDPFHMLRLKLLAIRVGIRGFTSPTPNSPISRNRSQERRFLIRESFGLPVAVLGIR
ncbi:MAG: YdcF family protein [Gemmatimonadetes bacterium]|nr:YdcF family protein [Gemmatimonadota bacterium]